MASVLPFSLQTSYGMTFTTQILLSDIFSSDCHVSVERNILLCNGDKIINCSSFSDINVSFKPVFFCKKHIRFAKYVFFLKHAQYSPMRTKTFQKKVKTLNNPNDSSIYKICSTDSEK